MAKNMVVLGNGYVGSEYRKRGYTVLDKTQFEITHELHSNPVELNKYLDEKLGQYQYIVNCIAKSNTRYCESNLQDALFSNGIIPGVLSKWCNDNNKMFIHISTGCLYDRNNTPQKETDFLAAHCQYTLSKWLGERNTNPETDLIIRPRLLFDASTKPNNLLVKVGTFSKLCNELESITSIYTIIESIDALILNNCRGIFNVACDGFITMQRVGEILGLSKPIAVMDQVRLDNKIYLVNNIMDISKLKKYYTPPNTESEIIRCYHNMTS